LIAEKRPWQKPQLIVLVRSRSEETVLGACKHKGQPKIAGPASNDCKSGNANCFDLSLS